jgi:opacity protein-like surface antigen
MTVPGRSSAQAGDAGDQGEMDKTEKTDDREIHPYVEYSAGLSMVRDQDLCCGTDRSSVPSTRFGGKYETSMPGYVVGGAVGARYAKYLRGELQLSWRASEIDRMPVNGGPSPANGTVGLLAVMTNVYGDLDLDWGVIPYAGIGIGYGLISLDAESDNSESPGATQIDAKQSVFVWNLMAGLTLPFSEVTEFSLGYRYLATTDPKFKARIDNVDPGGRGNRFLDSEFDSHELTAGVRFLF